MKRIKVKKINSANGSSKSRKNANKSKKDVNEEITNLIMRDHEEIKKFILILKNSKMEISKKKPAFAEFEQVLSRHAKAEQESLYDYMKDEDELRVEGLEGDTEHALADQLIEEIELASNDDDKWMAKVKVLAELVDHHVKEEEKNLLKKVRKEIDLNTRIKIGKEYSNLFSKNPSKEPKMKNNEIIFSQGEYV